MTHGALSVVWSRGEGAVGVPGVGRKTSPAVFFGEAPGRSEIEDPGADDEATIAEAVREVALGMAGRSNREGEKQISAG